MFILNPTLKKNNSLTDIDAITPKMTIKGTIIKISFLFGLSLLSAVKLILLLQEIRGPYDLRKVYYVFIFFPSFIIGAIFIVLTIYNPKWSLITAFIYALLKGLHISFFIYTCHHSAFFRKTLLLKFCILVSTLAIHQLGIIKVTPQLKTIVFSVTSAISIVYILTFILGLFGTHMPYTYDSTISYFSFSVVKLVVIAFNLLGDFDFIVKAQQHGLPKYMEWYSALSLMLTLVWVFESVAWFFIIWAFLFFINKLVSLVKVYKNKD